MKEKRPIKINNGGYLEVWLEDGWYSQHRWVVEQFIGRKLTSNEVIHHIDFNKENNSISNLMVFANQKEHAEFHIYFSKYGFNQRVRRIIKDRWKKYK